MAFDIRTGMSDAQKAFEKKEQEKEQKVVVKSESKPSEPETSKLETVPPVEIEINRE